MPLMSRIFLISLFLTFVAIIESKDFCQSFRDNGNRISYGFRKIETKTPEAYVHYIIIGQTYWQLKYEDKYQNMTFVSTNGTESNWFGNQYSNAFCIYYDIWQSVGCKAFGTVKNGQKLDIALMYRNELIVYWNMMFDFTRNWDHSIVFVPVWDQFNRHLVIDFKPNKRNYSVFELKEENDMVVVKHFSYTTGSGVESDALKELSEKPEVVAIYGQYSHADGEKDEKLGDGMVILFQKGLTILYCYTYARTLNPLCKPEELKTLIACPDISDSLILLWIGILVIIAIILCFIIVVVVLYNRKDKSQTSVTTGKSSRISRQKSSKSADIPKSKVIKAKTGSPKK